MSLATEVHGTSLRKARYTLNNRIIKFYNGDDVMLPNRTELQETKTRPMTF